MLITLDNVTIDYTLHFGFYTSNNEAKYEALITMELSAQRQKLLVYNDS